MANKIYKRQRKEFRGHLVAVDYHTAKSASRRFGWSEYELTINLRRYIRELLVMNEEAEARGLVGFFQDGLGDYLETKLRERKRKANLINQKADRRIGKNAR